MTLLDVTATLPPRRPPTLPPTNDALRGIELSVRARMQHLLEVESGGPDAVQIELAICSQNIFYWFQHYVWTYDPRNLLETPQLPALLPFDLFPRQVELIKWFFAMMEAREDGCLKKSRDIGFTWLAGAFAWWHWRFRPGFKTAFCSSLAKLVDELGNPDTIFEKIRYLYKNLPKWMWPPGFDPGVHDKMLLLINPLTGSTIRGEGGDEAGRGGRSTMYFVDEAAKIERAERVDAATLGNAECRIWGSSINPQNENNFFQRKYSSMPADRVFRFHYSADPRKTPEWAAKKKRQTTEENWAAEYEIDDSYTVEDIVIPRSWVDSAKRVKGLIADQQARYLEATRRASEARERGDEAGAGVALAEATKYERARELRLEPKVEGVAGGDIGGGKAHSVVVARFGPVVVRPQAWLKPDTIDTALKMLDYCEHLKLPKRGDLWEPKVKALRYDSVAIGQGVESVMKRNQRVGLVVTGVNTGDAPSETKWPDGLKAAEKFFNLKAELWWEARERFKKTHEMVLWLEDKRDSDNEPLGQKHPIEDCISLPDDPNDQQLQRMLDQLSQVKWTRRENGKIQIESKQSMSKRGLASPDHADALILTFGRTKADKWIEFSKVQV